MAAGEGELDGRQAEKCQCQPHDTECDSTALLPLVSRGSPSLSLVQRLGVELRALNAEVLDCAWASLLERLVGRFT